LVEEISHEKRSPREEESTRRGVHEKRSPREEESALDSHEKRSQAQ